GRPGVARTRRCTGPRFGSQAPWWPPSRARSRQSLDLRFGSQRRGAHPAGLGDIQHDAVGATVLDFDVAARPVTLANAERLVHVITRCRAGGTELVSDPGETLNLEADVMNACPLTTALGARNRVALEAQDGQIDVAVAEVVPTGTG